VMRFNENDYLVFKVETHNTPCALDPYGGAL
jgi:phosphoribosylformylglycinamidine synthase